MHDVTVSAMLFGSAAINNALVDMRTANPNGIIPTFGGKIGFQFYDTWVQVKYTHNYICNEMFTYCSTFIACCVRLFSRI